MELLHSTVTDAIYIMRSFSTEYRRTWGERQIHASFRDIQRLTVIIFVCYNQKKCPTLLLKIIHALPHKYYTYGNIDYTYTKW